MAEIVRFVAPIAGVQAAQGEGEAPAEARTIEGVAITYGVEAVAANGNTYLFRPGSLALARDTTPVLLGHDRQRPAGVLRELRQSDDAAHAVLRLDTTPDGDLALAQAASGSRAGLSVGAEPTVFTITADGVIEVEAAELAELSLVTIGAYPGAGVTRVNANRGERAMTAALQSPEPPAPDPAPAPAPAPEPDPLPDVQLAGRPRLVLTERPAPKLTADQWVGALVNAAAGDAEARRFIEAAATLVPSLVADNPGAIPPTITTQILGEVPSNRPLASICAQRPLPASGMLIRKPIWTTKPDGGWMASDAADPATNAPKIGLHDVTIMQWAYAFRTSIAVAERSSPDYVESVYRMSIIDYQNDVEVKIAAVLNGIAAVADQSIGEAFAALNTATGRAADLLVCSAGAFGKLLDAGGLNQFSTGSVSASPMRGSIYGLDVVVSGHLAADTAYVGIKGALELRESAPIRLSANVIGAMQVELGITSFASLDQEIPGAFAPVDTSGLGTLPAGLLTGGRGGRAK